MRKFALAAFAAALFLIPAPSSASEAGGAKALTDVSSQVTIREGRRGGVRVRIGDRHGRGESRRRGARHGRGESRRRGARRGGDRCVVRKVTERRGGRKVTRTVRRGPGC